MESISEATTGTWRTGLCNCLEYGTQAGINPLEGGGTVVLATQVCQPVTLEPNETPYAIGCSNYPVSAISLAHLSTKVSSMADAWRKKTAGLCKRAGRILVASVASPFGKLCQNFCGSNPDACFCSFGRDQRNMFLAMDSLLKKLAYDRDPDNVFEILLYWVKTTHAGSDTMNTLVFRIAYLLNPLLTILLKVKLTSESDHIGDGDAGTTFLVKVHQTLLCTHKDLATELCEHGEFIDIHKAHYRLIALDKFKILSFRRYTDTLLAMGRKKKGPKDPAACGVLALLKSNDNKAKKNMSRHLHVPKSLMITDGNPPLELEEVGL